jgi:hypothetical protein
MRNEQNSAYFLTSNTDELFITRDAGKTWVKKNLPTNDPDPLTRIRAFSFLNADTAWILSNRAIYYTSDECSTLTSIPFSGSQDLSGPDIYFSSNRIGWIVGYVEKNHSHGGRIFHTDDAGVTWREQNNVAYLPDYYSPGIARQSIFKIHADNDGKRAWALGEDVGILHTFDGGEHWTPDTIPASPGMGFTDLTYNENTNTLWLTSEFNGIWKYEIPAESPIKAILPANKAGHFGAVTGKNNGISIPLNFSSSMAAIDIYNLAGRLVLNKTFTFTANGKFIFLSLGALPCGHYFGIANYYEKRRKTSQSIFNVNIIK